MHGVQELDTQHGLHAPAAQGLQAAIAHGLHAAAAHGLQAAIAHGLPAAAQGLQAVAAAAHWACTAVGKEAAIEKPAIPAAANILCRIVAVMTPLLKDEYKGAMIETP